MMHFSKVEMHREQQDQWLIENRCNATITVIKLSDVCERRTRLFFVDRLQTSKEKKQKSNIRLDN